MLRMSERKRSTREKEVSEGGGGKRKVKREGDVVSRRDTDTKILGQTKCLLHGITQEELDAAKIRDFSLRVYVATQMVPPGKVTRYRDIAEYIGNPKAVRAVGNALRKNPFAPTVPCHRVISSNASGAIGGFCGHLCGDMITKKAQLLLSEGIELTPGDKQSNTLVKLSDSTIFTFPKGKSSSSSSSSSS